MRSASACSQRTKPAAATPSASSIRMPNGIGTGIAFLSISVRGDHAVRWLALPHPGADRLPAEDQRHLVGMSLASPLARPRLLVDGHTINARVALPTQHVRPC